MSSQHDTPSVKVNDNPPQPPSVAKKSFFAANKMLITLVVTVVVIGITLAIALPLTLKKSGNGKSTKQTGNAAKEGESSSSSCSEFNWPAIIARESEQSGLDSRLIDHAFGMFLGAAIGDSLGSKVEFSSSPISREQMRMVFQMPGGGPHRIAAGQVTDDTELAVALARGIAAYAKDAGETARETAEVSGLQTKIAKEYFDWYQTGPFDIGLCTRQACAEEGDPQRMKSKALRYDAHKRAQSGPVNRQAPGETRRVSGGVSNGSLMRSTPLIAYGWRLKDDGSLARLMRADSSLTHANPYIYLVNACYAIAIRHLLTNHEENHAGQPRHLAAFDRVVSFLESELNGVPDLERSAESSEDTAILETHRRMYPRAVRDVMNWLGHIREGRTHKFNPATEMEGFIKIAFEHAFFSLRNNWSLKEALEYSISQGGDTDTNGCIVGGMVGALHGLSAVDHPEWLEKVMRCSPVRSGNRAHFHPKLCFNPEFIPDGQNYLMTLLENSPRQLAD